LFLKRKDAINEAIRRGIISASVGEELVALINKELLHINKLSKENK